MADQASRPSLLPASPALRGLLALVWIALAFFFVQPPVEVLRANLDSSIHASYAYFTAHGLQFGSEVNTTAGPYGFVAYGWDFSGELFWTRWALMIAYSLALSALSLWFFLACRGGWRWLWLVAVPACSSFGDNIYNLPVVLGGLYLVLTLSEAKARRAQAAVAVLLAFVALTKGTSLAVVLVVLGILALQAWWMGMPRRAGWVFLCFLVALLGWWMAARQNPLHLPAYLNGILHISAGYNEAMSLAEPLRRFQTGLALALTLLALFLWTGFRHRRSPVLAAASVLLIGLGFVAWKHGYVRADGHVLIFLDLAVLLALGAPVAERIAGARTGWLVGAGQLAFVVAAVVLSDRGGNELMAGRSQAVLRDLDSRWMANVKFVFHPASVREDFSARLAQSRERYELYTTRQRIGHRPVDFFGHDFGSIFLTGLNYRPAPMCCGTYHVYNRHFKELNVAHYLDPRARPDFILMRTQTVDGRWPGQDDSLSFLAILENYRPTLVERDPWMQVDTALLEAQPGARPLPAARPLGTRALKFGEMVEVPAVGNDEIILFQLETPYSLRGRVRGLLYKPPTIAMQVEAEGLDPAQQFRIIPGSASVPSVLSPALPATGDVLALFSNQPGKTVHRLRLVSPQPSGFAEAKMRITFSAVHRPAPLTGRVPRGYPRTVFTQVPDATEPEDPGVQLYHDLPTHYMHAPASMTFNLTSDERAIDFSFGIDEGAYLNGKTNGVEFFVELQREGGATQELFRRYLRPMNVPGDRGLQQAHVALPADAGAGAKLIVRTGPGEFNDGGWDWSYVTHVNIERANAK